MRLPHNTTRLDALLSPLIASAKKIGAKIHVGKVDVNYNVPHAEALLAGAPDTPAHAKSLQIRDELDEYSGQESRIIVFINFPNISDRTNYEKSLQWAKENNLIKTIAHDIYAIGAEYPELPREFSHMYVTITETTGFETEVTKRLLCTVVWENNARKAGLTLSEYLHSEVNYFAYTLPF